MADHTQLFATIDKSQSSKCWEFVQVWAYYPSGYPDQVHIAATLPASGTISEWERTLHLRTWQSVLRSSYGSCGITAENEARITYIHTYVHTYSSTYIHTYVLN